jgi:dethiobiotin synthetase
MSVYKPIFISGIGTGVGKTVVAAWLVKHLNAGYWKPIQTGCPPDSDTDTINKWVRPAPICFPPAYTFQPPLSPHLAAEQNGTSIQINNFKTPTHTGELIIEGAGGILVPINRNRETMLDLSIHLNTRIVIAVSHYLGAVNHTLLTLEVLKMKGITPVGIVFTGKSFADNKEIITQFSKVKILGEIPEFDLTPDGFNHMIKKAPLYGPIETGS